MAGDRVCFTLRQMESGSFPSERLQAVFSPFFFFLLLPDWLLLPFTKHLLFTSVLFSLTSDDKPSIEGHFPFIRSLFSSFLSSSLFPSFPFALWLFKPFCHRNKWVLNWHVVGLSPMEVHSFIIRSGKPHCKLGVIIIWRGIIPVRSANYSMCLDWDLKKKNYPEYRTGMRYITIIYKNQCHLTHPTFAVHEPASAYIRFSLISLKPDIKIHLCCPGWNCIDFSLGKIRLPGTSLPLTIFTSEISLVSVRSRYMLLSLTFQSKEHFVFHFLIALM